MKKTVKINIGDFAFCKKREFGLILWKNSVVKRTGKVETMYSGINLTPGPKWGLNWQSVDPEKATKKDLKKIMSGNLIKG